MKESKTPQWFQMMHEWLLSMEHKKALEAENYEVCELIQAEINRRIENGTLNEGLMQGFRRWNRETGKFEGEPKYEGLNGLFDNYKSNF